ISQNALREISMQTYQHLLQLDPTFHFGESQRQTMFDIIKAQKGIESNLKSVTQFFIPFISDIGLSAFFLLYHCGPFFFISFLATYSGYIWYTFDLSNYRIQAMKLQKQYDRQADFTLSETLSNYYNVKYYNAEQFEIQRYADIQKKYQEQAILNQQTLSKLNSGQRIIFSAGLTANMIYGAFKVQQGLMRAGDIVLVQSVMMQVYQPLFILGVQWREWTNSSLDIQRLFKIMDMKPKIQDKENAINYQYKGGEIVLKNASFSYNDKKEILKNLSIVFDQKKLISIVGKSGIGKTTMFNLIVRLYDPIQGDVFIDGQNLKDLKQSSYRKYVCVISQHPYLFYDTILSNILYGSNNKSQEQVIEICKSLNLHDLIMGLPQGYNTYVGEQGYKFSGGERQRISIARALVNDSSILLMDEPTSSLDSKNEEDFMKIIQKIKKDKTIIMITHRLHLNDYFDEVLYIDAEGFYEKGSNYELINKQDGMYKMFWENI
ncbi:hypothetical protein IMG5_195130, partial [Ichthyophthirius multifiliis]